MRVKRFVFVLGVLNIVIFSTVSKSQAADISKLQLRHIPIEKRWDNPKPGRLPEVDGVLFDGYFYSGQPNHPVLGPGDKAYTPIRRGGFSMADGKRYFNRPIFYKGCMLSTGDRPMFLIHRCFAHAWCSKLRFSFSRSGEAKWLDEFESVYAEFWPGSTHYTCKDTELGLEVKLVARTGMQGWSSLFETEVSGPGADEAKITWVFGDIENYYKHKDWMYWMPPLELAADANNAASKIDENIYRVEIEPVEGEQNWKKVLGHGFVGLKSLEYYAGSNWDRQKMMLVNSDAVASAPVDLQPAEDGRLIGCKAPVKKGWKGTMVVVWGGEPYDKSGYEAAMRRLNIEWGMKLYWKWLENFVGRGSKPLESMRKIMVSPQAAVAEAEKFWEKIRKRIVIEVPDDELTAWANWLVASQEYLNWPIGQIDGIDPWGHGYLHISNMYDGWDYVGVHDQQEEWLRIFASSVRKGWIGLYHGIAPWAAPLDTPNCGAENEITHFINCVYSHWLWTGNDQFVKDVWPFAKQCIDRELSWCDPDGDGLFASKQSDWAPEMDSFGPKSQLETAQVYRSLTGCIRMGRVAEDTEAVKRYSAYAKKIEKALPTLWDSKRGVLGYRGPDDVLRRSPATSAEVFFPILRDCVTDKQAYQMLRYAEDSLMARTEEYPHVKRMMLSAAHTPKHQLGPLTDMSTRIYAAAGIAGAADHFYPVLKTLAHAYFFSSWPGGETVGVAKNGAGHAGMNDHNDGRMPALYALGRGLFGFEPDVPNGRITIEPRFPKDWKKASIQQPTIGYSFEETDEQVIMKVTTTKPLEKILRIPVLRQVKAVTLDGKKVNFEIDAGINRCFVVVKIPKGIENVVAVDLNGPELAVCYESGQVVGVAFKVKVEGAEKMELDDPQEALKVIKSGKDELELIPVRKGPRTAFVKAKRGNIEVHLPLDLRVIEAFEISNPIICRDESRLKFDLVNRSGRSEVLKANVEIAGSRTQSRIDLGKGKRIGVEVSLDESTMESILPGSNPIKLTIDGKTYRNKFINWDVCGVSDDELFERVVLLDIAWDYYEEASSIFDSKFIYDEWIMGIDYPVQINTTYEHSKYSLPNPKLQSRYFLAGGKVPFYVTDESSIGGQYQPYSGGGPRNVLPVANWRPGLYPSNLVIPVDGMKLSKVYFLAHSWYRGHQSHHPNVELWVNYKDGTGEYRQLIPPFSYGPQYGKKSMSAFDYNIEVLRTDLPVGSYLSADIYDLPVNPRKEAESIEVRSVTSESIFSIFGINLIKAE